MSYASPNAWRAAMGYPKYEKTPEEMADEYVDKFYPSKSWSATLRSQLRRAYLAGLYESRK